MIAARRNAAGGIILVVGGHGFMGSHAVRALAREGRQVRVLDVSERPRLEPVPGVEVVAGDFGDDQGLARALEGVEAVVHAGGVSLPAAGLGEATQDVEGELSRSVRLAAACVAHGVRRLVFASSGGTIYGDAGVDRIAETQPPAPTTSYAVTKLATELYLDVFRRLHGLHTVVLRIGNPYGPGQPPAGRQGFVAVLLGSLLTGTELPLWGDGSVVRDFVYVEDVGRAFAAAVGVPESAPRLYNIGSGRGRSLREVLEAAARVTGRTPRIAQAPERRIEIRRNVMDPSLAARHLGWSASTELEDGLAWTWDWMRATLGGEAGLPSAASALADG